MVLTLGVAMPLNDQKINLRGCEMIGRRENKTKHGSATQNNVFSLTFLLSLLVTCKELDTFISSCL